MCVLNVVLNDNERVENIHVKMNMIGVGTWTHINIISGKNKD